ncbi:uncharacterized protein LOC124678314 [Lolium rigidum]|uniref:uncharacterized protein LOC124678314 n=1 Tax=Lolium rigidum TaxID=89674 RepID=UPI001F5D7202|nr:uncharacterized protein LOC124678314 [Lolium rigidum]
MDLGQGMNEECYISLQSAGRGVTFTELLTMVATEAEQSKFTVDRHAQVNEQMVVGSAEENETEKCIDSSANRAAGNIEEGFLDTNLEFSTETLTQPGAAFDRREGNFGSKLPDESIGTSCFVDSSVNFGGSNCSDGISKASFSRTISNYQLEEDCGATDVTSQVREFNGGLIEESMRKYCEDKKSIMFEPEVGMQFSSTEEAFQFYMYSWVLGFSIRLGDNYTTKTKQRTMQEYLCQRQVQENTS